MRQILFKGQSELLADIEADLDDTNNFRWSDVNIYRALNRGVESWADKVFVPRVHSLSLVSGQRNYDLPAYISPPFTVELRGMISGGENVWRQMVTISTEPDAEWDSVLRFPFSAPTGEGRVRWWATNSVMPTSVPTLASALTSSADSLTIDATPYISDTGCVRVGRELIFYAGVTEESDNLTLSNLVRGVSGSTAAAHDVGVDVEWVVMADSPKLWEQLRSEAIGQLHAMLLHRGAKEDIGQHEKMMSFYLDRSARFWSTSGYVSAKPKRLSIGQRNMKTWL